MIMNRRNVLFVLGTTVLLGGLLIGSGAFSQVQADRTVSVNTEGDASASLGLDVNSTANHDGVSSTTEGGAIELSFEKVNDNASVYYDDVLNVSNNANQEITVTAYSNNSAVEVYDGNGHSFEFDSNNEATINTVPTNETRSLGIALNTSDSTIESEGASITIVAERK